MRLIFSAVITNSWPNCRSLKDPVIFLAFALDLLQETISF